MGALLSYAYFLKVSISLAVFYILYKLTEHRNTYFQVRRFLLLSVLVFSALYPLANIGGWIGSTVQLESLGRPYLATLDEFTLYSESTDKGFDWQEIFFLAYIAVAVLLFFKMMFSIISIMRIALHARPEKVMGVWVYECAEDCSPFSFFGMIFINSQKFTRTQLGEILLHEMTHCRQWHSVDVIVAELFSAVFWLNPCVWLLRREIRVNLEHLSDARVIQGVSDAQEYQMDMLRLCCKVDENVLANNFNISQFKKRIKMMNTHPSGRGVLLRYAVILPLVAALVIGVSLHARRSAMEQDVDDIYLNVDKMPEFPGGMAGMFNYLGENINYPHESQLREQEGRVMVRYVIDAQGYVKGGRVISGICEELDREALRLVREMPRWTPGVKDGRNVAVQLNQPIVFRFSDTQNQIRPDDMKTMQVTARRYALYDEYLMVVDGKIQSDGFKLDMIDPRRIASVVLLKDEADYARYKDVMGENTGVIEVRLK